MSEYTNIMALAKENNFKKIMVQRNSWNFGNWCIVNKVILKPDGIYGSAYGHTHYSNGKGDNGKIDCAHTYAWKLIKVLDEDMEVVQL